MHEGQTEPRGEGLEMRTDKAAAIRSAEALLITTWKRLKATGKQLSAEEHFALMQDFLDLFKSLGQYATEHQGLTVDAAPQTRLKADIEGGTEPTISLTAPAGIAATTPKTILSYAGANIDSVASLNFQQTAGSYYIVNAGKGISNFAYQGGISHIAHHGKLLLQSQHDDTQIDSAKRVQINAVGDVVITGQSLTFIAKDGSFIKIGDGITLGTNSVIAQKASDFTLDGPATLSTSPPSFTEGTLKRELLFNYHDDAPVQGAGFKIDYDNGASFTGAVDAQGKADLTGAPMGTGRIKLGEDTRAFQIKASEPSPTYQPAWSESDMQASFDKAQGAAQ